MQTVLCTTIDDPLDVASLQVLWKQWLEIQARGYPWSPVAGSCWHRYQKLNGIETYTSASLRFAPHNTRQIYLVRTAPLASKLFSNATEQATAVPPSRLFLSSLGVVRSGLRALKRQSAPTNSTTSFGRVSRCATPSESSVPNPLFIGRMDAKF